MQLNLCDLSACPRVWPCVSVYRVWELQDVIVSFCVCVFQPWEACRVSEEIPKALCKALQMRPAGRFLHLQKPQTPSTACCAALGLPWCPSSFAPERRPSGHSPTTPTTPVYIHLPLLLLPSRIGLQPQTFAKGVTFFQKIVWENGV